MVAADSRTRIRLQILLASFLILFQELALIRWLGVEIRAIAYFPNLVLIGAFLGIGVGGVLSEKRSLIAWWPVGLGLLMLATMAMARIVFTHEGKSEHLWLLYYDATPDAWVVPSVLPPILVSFTLCVLSFVPLGQFLAQRIQQYRELHDPLGGYAWDISGSIAGVAGFAVLGLLGLPPLVWFGTIAVLGLALLWRARTAAAVYVVLAAGMLTLVAVNDRYPIYSPYYALDARETGVGVDVLANGALHQVALDFESDRAIATDGFIDPRQGYPIPYQRLGEPPSRVLILGGGTGNDAAVALAAGAESIDVVEIDPAILRIGLRAHPNRPYDSDRVRRINTDARSYLNRTDQRYDLIVFATLDSMTRLSALSNVRLDNFVYTQESIDLARDRLTPGGGLAMYFMSGEADIDERLVALHVNAFGEYPWIDGRHHGLFNRLLLSGPAFSSLNADGRAEALARYRADVGAHDPAPRDDWPYLYLAGRQISSFYLQVIAAVLLISIVAVSGALRWAGGPGLFRRGGPRVDTVMFLFGFAFLLLETRAVTAMNLLWGATWITSAVVFGCVLAMVLAATLVVRRRPIPMRVGLAGTALATLGCYLVPAGSFAAAGLATKLLVSMLLVGLPVFFASICFAEVFRTRRHAGIAFGWNILGAVAGGLAEFLSMVLGLQAMALIALLAYLLIALRQGRNTEESPPARPAEA